jgi:uncharacterized membrane protein YhaH (DUF805 family)
LGETPVLLEVRERRSLFGRAVRSVFFGFQLLMILLLLGTCAVVTPFVASSDMEVAAGAGLFGAVATALLWLAWPLGTAVLGLLTVLTRGRKRLIPAPLAAAPPAAVPMQRDP